MPELLPFQERGSDLLAKSRRALLIWDAGVGKTPTACCAATKAGAERVLVFCPPVAVGVWKKHFYEWTDLRPIITVDGTSRTYPSAERSGVRIIPYSRAKPGSKLLWTTSKDLFHVVILDEIHYLKNPLAQRTRGVYGTSLDLKDTALAQALHVWGLSGTPVLNHAAEFWTHFHALRPDLIVHNGRVMDEETFTKRFCMTRQTPHGLRVYGSRNLSELAERVRPFIDRLKLSDALPDLPELRIVEHPLPADTDIPLKLKLELEEAAKKLGVSPDTLSDDELLAAVQSGAVAWSTTRRLTGRAKVEGVSALVRDALEDALEEKIVLFAHHRDVIAELETRLKGYAPLTITGSTPLHVRDERITRFQTLSAHRLIIVAIDAAGEAVTLNAARHVVLAEPSPVPAKNLQAIARAHRNGQRNSVVARFVLLPGTIDERLMQIVARKTRDIARIVDAAPALRASYADAFPT